MRSPKALLIAVVVIFFINGIGPMPSVLAEDLILPKPGVMVHLSPPMNPPLLKGIKVYTNDPFKFDFILDQGDSPVIASEAKQSQQEQLKREANRLIRYFLASLTVPDKDLWVNLSPYEKDRIIPDAFGQTEMGRDLLAQDYLLKQITASLIYPEEQVGKEFWQKVYSEAQKKFGTTNIPINTFNKVWIVPAKAIVYENVIASEAKQSQSVAYIVEAKLKVMLEQDYLALDKSQLPARGHVQERTTKNVSPSTLPSEPAVSAKGGSAFGGNVKATQGDSVSQTKDMNALGSQIVREIVIPQLEKEVNEGKNFAPLRQVYHSLILAAWYKQKIKQSILAKVYADKNKVTGVGYNKSIVNILPTRGHVQDRTTKNVSPSQLPSEAAVSAKGGSAFGGNVKAPQGTNLNDVEAIYNQYLQAFKKGVFNYIKEDVIASPQGEAISTGTTITRKYFSGGMSMAMTSLANTAMSVTNKRPVDLDSSHTVLVRAGVDRSRAMLVSKADERAKEILINKVRDFFEFSSVEGLSQWVEILADDVTRVNDFEEFKRVKISALKEILATHGMSISEEDGLLVILKILEWGVNLGLMNPSNFKWLKESFLSVPQVAVITPGLGGFGDLVRTRILVQNITSEFIRLKNPPPKVKVFVLKSDHEKFRNINQDLISMANVQVVFVDGEEVDAAKGELSGIDVLLTIARPVSTLVRYEDVKQLPAVSVTLTESGGDARVSLNERQPERYMDNIATGFSRSTKGLLLNQSVAALYEQIKMLSDLEKTNKKQQVLGDALRIKFKDRLSAGAVEKLVQAAETSWGYVYMHYESWKYLSAIRKINDQQEEKKSITLFTFLDDKNKVDPRTEDEWLLMMQDLSAKDRENIEFYDLRKNPNKLADIDFNKKIVRVINLGVVGTADVNFMALSDLPVGVTGDESLLQALLLRKSFMYEMMEWKKQLFKDLMEDMKKVMGLEISPTELINPPFVNDEMVKILFSKRMESDFKKYGDNILTRELTRGLIPELKVLFNFANWRNALEASLSHSSLVQASKGEKSQAMSVIEEKEARVHIEKWKKMDSLEKIQFLYSIKRSFMHNYPLAFSSVAVVREIFLYGLLDKDFTVRRGIVEINNEHLRINPNILLEHLKKPWISIDKYGIPDSYDRQKAIRNKRLALMILFLDVLKSDLLFTKIYFKEHPWDWDSLKANNYTKKMLGVHLEVQVVKALVEFENQQQWETAVGLISRNPEMSILGGDVSLDFGKVLILEVIRHEYKRKVLHVEDSYKNIYDIYIWRFIKMYLSREHQARLNALIDRLDLLKEVVAVDRNEKGGIDLTSAKLPLEVQRHSERSEVFQKTDPSGFGSQDDDVDDFSAKGGPPPKADQSLAEAFGWNINPAMLKQWEDAPGVEGVIFNIEPMQNIYQFLGAANPDAIVNQSS